MSAPQIAAHASRCAEIVDLEEQRAIRIVRLEAEQVAAGMRVALHAYDTHAVTDAEFLAMATR